MQENWKRKIGESTHTTTSTHTHTHTRGATVLFGFVMALQSQRKKALLHLIRLYIFFFPFVFALNREEMYLKKNKVLVWFKKWNGRQQKKNTQILKERQWKVLLKAKNSFTRQRHLFLSVFVGNYENGKEEKQKRTPKKNVINVESKNECKSVSLFFFFFIRLIIYFT